MTTQTLRHFVTISPEITGESADSTLSRARKALIFYGTDASPSFTHITQHDVIGPANPRPRLGPGVLLTHADIAEIARPARSLMRLKPQLLPEGTLYADDTMLVWMTPPQMQRWRFALFADHIVQDLDPKVREVLRSGSALMPTPSLVWILMKDAATSVKIYSYKDRTRPTLDTPLMLAPFPNMFVDSKVCWGTGIVPGPDEPVDAWVRAFWSSKFTQFNSYTTLRGGLKTYQKMMLSKATEFDPADLLDAQLTLGQAIAQCADTKARHVQA